MDGWNHFEGLKCSCDLKNQIFVFLIFFFFLASVVEKYGFIFVGNKKKHPSLHTFINPNFKAEEEN